MSNLNRRRILVGSYTNDIYTLSFDSAGGTLTMDSSVSVGFHPSWITFYPGDRSIVFTGLEETEGSVVALRYDDQGKGAVRGRAPSGGADPCSLLATENGELLIANYSSGTLGVLSISRQEPHLMTTSINTTQLVGKGPNKERQESSHAHHVYLNEEELLVADLGGDRVNRFGKVDGRWKPSGHIQFPAGSGPRHVACYDGHLYTLLELNSSVAQHRFPSLPEEPSLITVTPTMSNPPPFPNDMLAAEILIPPPNTSFPAPYIYVSNRNDPSPEGDTVAIFSLNPLELVAEVRTGLKHLRGMAFGGPDDRWLVAGGVHGGGVKVFERVDEGKGLKLLASNEGIEGSTAFLWV